MATLIVLPFISKGQATIPEGAGQNESPSDPSLPAAQNASAVLRSSLDTVQQTVEAVNLQKWKRGTVRDETADHIKAIQHDLQATLPPLLKEADAAPQIVSKLLPVSRNVSALYDVLLSVVEAARVSASGEQVEQLEKALSNLGSAQRGLDDQVQQCAVAVEKQVVDLRGTLAKTETAEKITPKPIAAANPCPAAGPVHRAKKPKPAQKPNPVPAPAATSPTVPK